MADLLPKLSPRLLPLLAAVAVAAGLGLTTSQAVADEGEAAFKARCGDCHGPREFPRWARARPDAEKRREWLDGFLKRHYPPPENERTLIIAYVERMIASSK